MSKQQSLQEAVVQGAKIAQTLIEKGYNVVVNYKQSKEKPKR